MKSFKNFCLIVILFLSANTFSQILPDDNNFIESYLTSVNINNSYFDYEESINSTLTQYSKLGEHIPISTNPGMLNNFFEALKNRAGKKIRIAHYGDSLIWGDIISSDLRKLFQREFGGSGPGMISICNDDLSIRKTVSHEFSEDWDWSSLFTRNKDRKPIGISGTVSTPGLSSWVSYRAEGDNSWYNTVRLFYSDVGNGAEVHFKSGDIIDKNVPLSTGKGLREEIIHAEENIKSVKLSFKNANKGNFYAVSLESDDGVYLDNFALRGTSGVSLLDIESDIYKGFQKSLNYELIILNFGLNAAEAASAEKSNYRWYHQRMIKVINYLKETFPQTSILMISVGDHTIKNGSKYQSDPAVMSMLEVQKMIAKETNVAFWNLFDAMGGENSMYKWVHNNPAYAYKDYAHFSDIGGQRIAELLYDSIMKEFNNNN